MNGKIRTARIYEPVSEEDGCRILADRLWPRGIKKEDAQIDEWVKETAPSSEIRKQFHQDGDYETFQKRYISELEQNENTTALISVIREHLKQENVTLLTASKDVNHCNVSVLCSYLLERI